MQFKNCDGTYFVSLDPGEEILSSLQEFCCQTGLKLATIQAIGAINEVTVGVFHPAEKRYESKNYSGDFEITSLLGTVTEVDGKPYLHLHINFADQSNQVLGGHLNKAVVSAACEIVVEPKNGAVDRYHSATVGLNLWKI